MCSEASVREQFLKEMKSKNLAITSEWLTFVSGKCTYLSDRKHSSSKPGQAHHQDINHQTTSNKMKKTTIKTITATLTVLISEAAWAQTTEQTLPAYIVNGRYFSKEMPLSTSNNIAKSMALIKDAEGHRALALFPQGDFRFTEDMLQYEIAKEKVQNIKQFEEQYALFIHMIKATTPTDTTQGALQTGAPLPGDFALKDLDGHSWSKASLAGKVAVINVWYSGCGPCRAEMPILSEWKARHPEVLFLSADFEKAEKVKSITTQCGFNWTHLVEDNYFTKWVGSKGFPLTIVVGADGNVQHIVHGTSEEKRTSILEAIDNLTAGKR